MFEQQGMIARRQLSKMNRNMRLPGVLIRDYKNFERYICILRHGFIQAASGIRRTVAPLYTGFMQAVWAIMRTIVQLHFVTRNLTRLS